jgi:hypothetical protein
MRLPAQPTHVESTTQPSSSPRPLKPSHPGKLQATPAQNQTSIPFAVPTPKADSTANVSGGISPASMTLSGPTAHPPWDSPTLAQNSTAPSYV